MSRLRWGFVLSLLSFAFAAQAQSQTADIVVTPQAEVDENLLPPKSIVTSEKERNAPIDYGFGPGVKPPSATSSLSTRAVMAVAPSAAAAIPTGGPTAHIQGVFGAAITWPIIGIHAVLLPDGRVMTYGSTETGAQGGQFVYDVWDPEQGTGPGSHLTLPNTTATDIFCSGQAVLAYNGEVLITGGDRTISGKRNYSTDQTTIFNPFNNTIRPNGSMVYARWYPTIVHMPNDDMLIVGGRQDFGVWTPVPEVFNPTTGWRTLPGAASLPAFGGAQGNWWYPQAFLAPNGKVFVLGHDGSMFSLDTSGDGSITRYVQKTLLGATQLPTLMYAPGRLLSLRQPKQAITINLTTTPPQVTTTSDVDQVRAWSNATVMADGQVFVNGGSEQVNKLVGVAYSSLIWNPNQGTWTTAASATKARLYHSIALLLPDGSILTGAGGAPGPVKNLNMEIYYPPYLYSNDGSGQLAPRPTITAAPVEVRVGQAFAASLDSGGAINRVAMVRTGSVTHSLNNDQRYIGVPYTQNGSELTVSLPADPDVMLPGYYMMFVIRNGVPSVAKIIRLTL